MDTTTATQTITNIEVAADTSVLQRAEAALIASLEALFDKQHPDGHWRAELEGDSILSSEFLLMRYFLHQEHEEPELHPQLHEGLCNHLKILQREDGSWGQYPGAPIDISASVKAYFALKLFDRDSTVDAEHMQRARAAILDAGGAENINTFSTFYLALLGQVTWDACPSIPPELVLLPRFFPFHLDKCASWTRTLIVPLAICSALRPARHVPSHLGIGELFKDHNSKDILAQRRNSTAPSATWEHTFLTIDTLLKTYQRAGFTPLRSTALDACKKWIEERSDPAQSDGLGAIFPPLVYIQVAYHALGEPRDHWLRQQCEHEINRWIVDGPDTNPPHKRIAPCFSPVWDTGIALYAMTETGVTAASDERLAKTCDWLREREVSVVGDWVHNLRPADRKLTMGQGGTDAAWAFEYRNEWSPDVDDTAMICKSLWRAGDRAGETANRDAARRGIRWILRMQNDDGGFAAFDRTKHRAWMEAIPFADHNAMQDPSCADITGRTLEALITCGIPQGHPVVKRAVRYLHHEQYDFGGWWGRWGVNFIYGTWQAVGGLVHAGEDPNQPYLQRTADWLRSIQQDDGGFGENANSYLSGEGGRKWIGVGKTTASQTSWAVMALMFLAGPEDPAVERAIHFLCNHQLKHPAPANFPEHPLEEPAGSWQESEFTGGGFPKVFYLRYHLYRHYFPQMALARYTNLINTK